MKTTSHSGNLCFANRTFVGVFIMLSLAFFNTVKSSDIVEVLPLTNKIIMVHFDDGKVVYPNTLTVDRLVMSDAQNVNNWTLSSTNDADYSQSKNAVSLGMKSRGTEFVKDAVWAGSSFDPRPKPWASEHWVYVVLPFELKTGKSYQLNSGNLAKNGSTWNFSYDERLLRSEAVHTNTLGYDSNAPKYGYIYQWMGTLGGLDLTSYATKTFSIYKVGESVPVKTGQIMKRKTATNIETGQTKDTPNQNFLGAEVYDCDFSDVTEAGNYHLVVDGIGSSYPFKIGKDAIWDAYYNVTRGLYYQRSGIRLAPPYANYVRPVNQNTKITSDDGISFAGKMFYSDYSYQDWNNDNTGGTSVDAIRTAAVGKPIDVAGWYHDAGDWDAYWTHQRIPIMMMTTWEFAPQLFADDELNIPESGNGIPDFVDEASWLIKFNYRLRKELKAKGYSNGGVGGARVCSDVYNSVDGNTEVNLPSWKETRRMVVTKADAYMTYLYAGQAAQLAIILKKVGKDPSNFQIELLDKVEFKNMTKDIVNLITEAEEAFTWASATENQPTKTTNYGMTVDKFRAYAAANLYRLTGKEEYNTIAKTEITKSLTSATFVDDNRWGAYSYLLSDNKSTDPVLKNQLTQKVISTATNNGVQPAENRAARWGGIFDFPMLIGQATTPAVFETMIAACLTKNKEFANVVNTTADYFLGTNPLHTTWMTGVGVRAIKSGFHLDTRYCNNWELYPGFIPYGPASLNYDYNPFTWIIDGVSMQGGAGPWNKHWHNFTMFPMVENWPGHERWCENIHAPQSSENTIHQNTVFGAVTYSFVNNRSYSNNSVTNKVGTITLDNTTLSFTEQGKTALITASVDVQNATFSTLKWVSSNPRIAHVNANGLITAVTPGTAQITCSTLDGSVVATCNVTCNWAEVPVESIAFAESNLSIFKGQQKKNDAIILPANATNKYINYTYNVPGIVSISDEGIISALAVGEVTVTATTVSGGKIATFVVLVKEATDHVISDFDTVIPVTDSPKPTIPQLYTPGGTKDVQFLNPFVGLANPSEKVVKYGRPTGEWKLIGIVLPTQIKQDLSQYSQIQFKYFSKDIKDFQVDLITKTSKIELIQNVEGENCWKLFTADFSSTDSLVQINVFVNKKGLPDPFTCYFDDFKLVSIPPTKVTQTTISDAAISLDKDNTYKLTANMYGFPYTWISTDEAVAKVDQKGLVTAIGGGKATIKAVPLYGDAVSCLVTVSGAPTPVYKESVFLDFETITLNSGGYTAVAWNSSTKAIVANPSVETSNPSAKVLSWDRDIAGTPQKLWGGYSMIFPVKNTTNWERFSFQMRADALVNTVRLEFLSGTTSVSVVQKDNLAIPANTWKTLTYNLADINLVEKSFDKVSVQIAGGSTIATMKTYSDNFKLESGPSNATGISKVEYKHLNIYPNPITDNFTIECSNPIKNLYIYNTDGKLVTTYDGANSSKVVLKNTIDKNGLYFIKIIDNTGSTYRNKIIINK